MNLFPFVRAEDVPPPPRIVRVVKGSMTVQVILWLMLATDLIVFPYFCVKGVSRLEELRSSGKVVEGKVVDRYIVDGKTYHHHLLVSFPLGDRYTTQNEEVTKYSYDSHPVGSSEKVTLSRTDPRDFELGEIDDYKVSSERGAWTFVMGLFAFFISVLIAATLYEILRDRRFLARGIATSGIVSNIRIVRGKSTTTYITYRYTTALSEREGKSSMSGFPGDRFKEGEATIVLYLPDNDRKSRPLPMISTVRLD